ncbi:MAG TPA: hypothetical protein VMW48_05890 [Vicinamibacterales bacterium]|nr:hypothetical protein [Vicinamibacterales bacterium]
MSAFRASTSPVRYPAAIIVPPWLWPPSPSTFDVVLEEVQIPLRDGVRRAVDFWRLWRGANDGVDPAGRIAGPRMKVDGPS